MKYPRRPRLKDFSYQGPFSYFVTTRTDRMRPYFHDNPRSIGVVLPILQQAARRFRFGIFAYCFMPDHLHLLLAGEEDSSLRDFMRIFKQRSGFRYKREHGVPLWQPSFYDHVLRKDESMREVARYIFENPVRKGMVDDFREYPLLGSMVFDINDL